MEFLHFMFSGFWTFVGMLFLLAVIFDGAAKVIRAIRNSPEIESE